MLKKLRLLLLNLTEKHFSCSCSMEDLEKNYPGAYRHILRFINEKNGKGIPLIQVLKRSNEEWY